MAAAIESGALGNPTCSSTVVAWGIALGPPRRRSFLVQHIQQHEILEAVRCFPFHPVSVNLDVSNIWKCYISWWRHQPRALSKTGARHYEELKRYSSAAPPGEAVPWRPTAGGAMGLGMKRRAQRSAVEEGSKSNRSQAVPNQDASDMTAAYGCLPTRPFWQYDLGADRRRVNHENWWLAVIHWLVSSCYLMVND